MDETLIARLYSESGGQWFSVQMEISGVPQGSALGLMFFNRSSVTLSVGLSALPASLQAISSCVVMLTQVRNGMPSKELD